MPTQFVGKARVQPVVEIGLGLGLGLGLAAAMDEEDPLQMGCSLRYGRAGNQTSCHKLAGMALGEEVWVLRGALRGR